MPKKTKEFQDAASLVRIAEQVRVMATRIESAKDTMELNKITPLEITGYADLTGGLERLERFANSCHICLRRYLEDSGAFRADNGGPAAS